MSLRAAARILLLVVTLVLLTQAKPIAGMPTHRPRFTMAVFRADVTPPLGHTLEGTFSIKPALKVADPLLAHGFVLRGAGEPIVLVSVDWCGIANEAHDRWREVLARAAGTRPSRVLVCTIHQHDAPIADFVSERLFSARHPGHHLLDLKYHEAAVRKVADALRLSLKSARPVTHIGMGQAKVDRIASNRRILGKDGRIAFVRYSSSTDPRAKEAPEGLVDPFLKTLSFWEGDKAIASISVYATHPMSYYGQGEVSADFVGIARSRRQAEDPHVMHFYANGCGGNIAAGKYNDGTPASRVALAERLHAAWKVAWENTRKTPLERIGFRSVRVKLPPKETTGFRPADLRGILADESSGENGRARAALVLAWRDRCDSGRAIDVPALDLGPAQLLLLPGEPFVEYQLFAQRLRPNAFVLTLGYGDYGPGYVPTNAAYAEGGYEPGDYSFVAPGVEAAMKGALRKALGQTEAPVRPATRARRRRVLYNLDGDSCLVTRAHSKEPVATTTDDLKRLIAEIAYKGSCVDTFLVCINAQVVYYPTKVGTMRGDRSTPEERAKWPASEHQLYKNFREFYKAGIDPYAVMLAEAKRRGLEAMITFRMNDAHGNDFLRTQFWEEHQDCRHGNGALDFGREEVRDYTYRLIEEAVGRYPCDGLELDFNRFPNFFKDGTAVEERVAKMNGLVERVRAMMDRVGKERKRRLTLSVRVPSNFGRTPPTPETARALGCDIAEWVKRGWVDFVTVSEFLFERGDLPIGLWKHAIMTVPVYGGIECTKGAVGKNLSADEYRQAAAKLWEQHADGIYLFNFFTSREGGPNAYEPPFEVMRDLGRKPSSKKPELRPAVFDRGGAASIEYRLGDLVVARPTDGAPAGVELMLPNAPHAPVRFPLPASQEMPLTLGPVQMGALTLRMRISRRTPELIERTVEIKANAAARFSLAFPLEMAEKGEYATFTGPVTERTLFETVRGTPHTETFPVAMLRTSDRVFGVAADSPGLWENRCETLVAPSNRQLSILTGDGRDPYLLVVKPPEDARDTYQYQMDGWQTLAAGETRRFTTWVFTSPARTHYDAQVAAHLAVANAKGWNGSALEAILRNTSYYLLRRNLARDADDRPRDGRFIFISGPGYGWKQWVSDGFWTALGLDDAEKTIESNRAVFWTRMDYEDNAQYYLIWAALMKRAGGRVNEGLICKAYEFLRRNEKDGFYIPPSLPGAPNPRVMKTYHDMLEYDADDSPASDQGFHCGALLAAKELGLPATDAEIERAIVAYRSIFNVQRGFMPTSRKLADTLGQDTLYGATLTYAVFGRKLLTDAQVLSHVRYSETVKSPFGLRVISTAEGALLPGHSGVYVYGGSWYLNDAANYLLAGVHGLPAAEADRLLVERIEKEIAFVPAFNESISTVTGKPHGHVLYSWNSGYWWLRTTIRRRLRQAGPDPVAAAIDARLGVVKEKGALTLKQ